MWLCVSTMPGTTTRPRASTVRAPLPAIRGATCAIAPSFTATSWTPSIPEAGSITRPPRTIRSNFAIASLQRVDVRRLSRGARHRDVSAQSPSAPQSVLVVYADGPAWSTHNILVKVRDKLARDMSLAAAQTESSGHGRIPVLDIGAYLAGEAGSAAPLARAIARTCEDTGFLVVANHGV